MRAGPPEKAGANIKAESAKSEINFISESEEETKYRSVRQRSDSKFASTAGVSEEPHKSDRVTPNRIVPLLRVVIVFCR